ncbi:MAG TPA: hypothetical protein VGJ09_07305 [Bryobacteraceae bacterium]|jgi:hypothetical protein
MGSFSAPIAWHSWTIPLADSSVAPLVPQSSQPIWILIICLLIAVPIALMLASVPIWIASKVVTQSYYATYPRALGVLVGQTVALIVLGALQAMIQFQTGSSTALGIGFTIVEIGVCILITAKMFDIGALRAIGLHILSNLITLVLAFLLFFGAVAIFGMTSARQSLDAAYQKFRGVQTGAWRPASSGNEQPPLSFVPSPAPGVPDEGTDIDGLLNAALHPIGAKPPLIERENTVRLLQQRLQAQRNSLPAGDTHAALVYNNQYNRYLLLLKDVQAERRAESARAAKAGRSDNPH